MSEKKSDFISGLKGGIPIGLGYLAVSFTFGIMAVQAGIPIGTSALMSLTNVTSAGQFGALDVIMSGGLYIELALNQLIINLRYSLMSLAVSQRIDRKYPFFHRFFMAFGMTDEIFGISISRPEQITPYYVYGAMAVAIPGWVTGTILGAVAGKLLPMFIVSALSIAIYGMFIAIIIPSARKNKKLIWVIIAAMLLSAAFKYVPGLNSVSPGFSIIIVTVVVSVIAAIISPVKDGETEKVDAG